MAPGFRSVEREGPLRELIRCLKHGASAGLLVDQRDDSAEPTPFFGRDMLTWITPALQGARYRVIFHKPVTADDPSAGPIEQTTNITFNINILIEDWLRQRPHEWVCTKRRRPKNQNGG